MRGWRLLSIDIVFCSAFCYFRHLTLPGNGVFTHLKNGFHLWHILAGYCMVSCHIFTRTNFKNRILVQDRGGAEFQTAGNLLVVEDLKRGTNKDMGPKDIFEIGSNAEQEVLWPGRKIPLQRNHSGKEQSSPPFSL